MPKKGDTRRGAAAFIFVVSALAILSAAAWLGLLLNQIGVEVRLPPVGAGIGIAISFFGGVSAVMMTRAIRKAPPAVVAAPLPAAAAERAQGGPFIDPLTGIASRTWFDWTLNVEIERSRRYGHPLSVIVVVIDRFAEVRAAAGNAAADYILMKIAEIMRSRVRQTDQAARLRGEEYAVIASETDEKGTLVAAEKLRHAIEIYPFDENLEVTVSAGVAGLAATDTAPLILQRAERAAAAARAKGGNSVARTAG